MDDFLSKPFEFELLYHKLDLWGGQKEKSEKTVVAPVLLESPMVTDVGPPIYLEEVLERVMGDSVFIKGLVWEFLGDLGADIAAIRETVRAGNADELNRKAHRLKGAAASLSMKPLAQIAFLLEQQGKSGQLDDSAVDL